MIIIINEIKKAKDGLWVRPSSLGDALENAGVKEAYEQYQDLARSTYWFDLKNGDQLKVVIGAYKLVHCVVEPYNAKDFENRKIIKMR